jgi:hypothetical protein
MPGSGGEHRDPGWLFLLGGEPERGVRLSGYQARGGRGSGSLTLASVPPGGYRGG